MAPLDEPAMTYLPPPEKQALFQSHVFLYFSDLVCSQIVVIVNRSSRGMLKLSWKRVRETLGNLEVGSDVQKLERAISRIRQNRTTV